MKIVPPRLPRTVRRTQTPPQLDHSWTQRVLTQSRGGLGVDPYHPAGLRVLHLRQDTGNKRDEIFECVARRDKNEHEEARLSKVLLKLKVLIRGDEDLIARFCRSPEELAVL